MSAPSIVGCLSTFSSSVRLRGQVVDAAVTVFRNGDPILRHRATGFDEVFDFDPGVVLDVGDKITTSQRVGTYESQPSSVITEVQRRDPPYGGHRFVSHVYRCGRTEPSPALRQ